MKVSQLIALLQPHPDVEILIEERDENGSTFLSPLAAVRIEANRDGSVDITLVL